MFAVKMDGELGIAAYSKLASVELACDDDDWIWKECGKKSGVNSYIYDSITRLSVCPSSIRMRHWNFAKSDRLDWKGRILILEVVHCPTPDFFRTLGNTLPEFLATMANPSALVKFIHARLDLSRTEGTRLAA